MALPPENDVPEEVLATGIIVQGRSSLNNQPLTASEYTAEKEEESIEKVCKLCEKKFSNRASEYCSSECANKSMV